MNNDKFRANIKKRVERAKEKTQIYLQKFVVELDERIIQKTPVDTGNLRWNWFVGIGNLNYTTDENGGDASGAIARNNSVINSTKFSGQTIYITNSLPYAYRVEYEGWSKYKAPAGMMRISIEEMKVVADKLAIDVRAMR